MKICFIQFSNLFFDKEIDDISTYYNNIYDTRGVDGYYRNEHFYEIPLWIAKIDGLLKMNVDKDITTEVHFVTDLNNTIQFINNNNFDAILFSVMDVNRNYISEIISNSITDSQFIIGGYTDLPTEIDGKYIWVDYVEGICDILDVDYFDTISYRLFKGQKIIPRLEMSTGCAYNCSFCTIGGSKVKVTNTGDIIQNLMEIVNHLDFKLIYIDDKTFGQAKNYKDLEIYYNLVKYFKPDFEGFIIQTSIHYLRDKKFTDEFKKIGVAIAEVGFETLNPDTLKFLNKSNEVEEYQTIVDNCVNSGLKLIPNFMIGLPLETKESYERTLNFIRKNMDKIYIMNIYNLAIYGDTDLAKRLNATTPDDYNELVVRKSFHTDEENENALEFSNKIFGLGNKIFRNEKS